ncbi:MAG: ShlB/FhaC/HecB family hemolysin secretion/activation protein, partial [Cyanobacteria bacterium J06627_8]
MGNFNMNQLTLRSVVPASTVSMCFIAGSALALPPLTTEAIATSTVPLIEMNVSSDSARVAETISAGLSAQLASYPIDASHSATPHTLAAVSPAALSGPERSQPEFAGDAGDISIRDTSLNGTSQAPHHEQAPIDIAQQLNPNEERIPTPEPLEPDDEVPLAPELDSEPAEPDEDAEPDDPSPVQFEVQSIDVLDSTVFDDGDFDPIVVPVEGTFVTLEELQQVADAITQLYLDDGYLTSRAILVDQVITDGVVQIQIIEGRISEIQVTGLNRLREDYVRNRIELGANMPLRTDRLEDQLRLLRADPNIENIEASLRAGEDLGESILVVRVVEDDPFLGNLRADNYSPPSVGSDRVGFTLGWGNVSGRGDSFIVGYDRTAQGGSQVADFNYRIPVNPMNGAVELRATIDRNEVVQEPFDELEIEGASERYEVTFRQPLVRSPREEFALSLGFAYRDGEVLAFDLIPLSIGANESGVTRTSVFRFGQDYVKRDFQGAWALRSQFSIGAGILNATENEGIPDSRFFSWLGQAQRVQRIGNNHLLIAQLDMQFTPDALLSSEQFVIGGGQSLRGYRQNVRAGDNGIRFSLEDRITLARNASGASTFQVAPFFDMGVVWNDSDNVDLPDQTFLAGIGTGFLWEIFPNLNLRL